MKNCSGCGPQPKANFAVRAASMDGLAYRCKACVLADARRLNRSPNGKLVEMYASQCTRSKKRGHPLPDYTVEQWCAWAKRNGYDLLYATWQRSGFEKRLAPSGDRLYNDSPYTLNNLRLVTWEQNHLQECKDIKNGDLITAGQTAVEQWSKDGEFIAPFHSLTAATNATGINQGNILKVCQGKGKSAGGYVWRFPA